MDEMKRNKRNLFMFPLGTVGRDMMYALFNSFLLTYILFTRTLTAAQLSAITFIMVAARLFDAFNDPIMGNIIERTRTKYGKFKPWLVIGIVSSCAVIYAAFNSGFQGWGFIVFFGIAYLLYSVAYTMHDISYWGMIASLTSDSDMRNRLTSLATLCAGVGGTLAGLLVPLLTTGNFALGGNAQTAYGRIALVFCIIGPAFLCFTIFGVKERKEEKIRKAPPVSYRKILSTIVNNKQLLWIAIIFLIQQIGNNVAVNGIGSTYIYFAFGYEGGLYSIFSTVGVLATAFMMIFYPAISRKVKRKKLLSIGITISAVGYALMLAVGLVLKTSTVKFVLLTAGYMAANFGQYTFYLVMMISIINTVEYNEYLFGERDEAIIASLRPFLTKMAAALVIALTSLTYILCGVTDVTNRISALENSATQGLITEAEKLSGISEVIKSVSPSQTVGLFVTMTVLPFILMTISYVLYQKKYTLDEDKYESIVRELSGKKEEQA
ncbi:MAG: MFS transporter [Clostridia bacterium]|nr:MFS transporter [Clostridia bacterium]